MEIQHRLAHSRDMQNGHAAQTCSMDMQHENSAWKCSTDMWHGYAERHAAWTCTEKQQGHVALTWMDLRQKNGHETRICSMVMQHGQAAYIEMQGQAAWRCSMHMHRWAPLLKQQSSITVNHLPTKENKRLCPVSVCSKQKKLCRSRLQKTDGSCRFPLVPLSVCGIPKTWMHGHGDIVTWKWRHGDMETRRHGHVESSNGKWKWKLRRFSLIHLLFAHCENGSLSFVRLLMKKQTEAIRLQTD